MSELGLFPTTADSSADDPILLHTCCAPCCCAIIDQLLSEGIRPDLFFYNPNIHPFFEYIRRKESVISYAKKIGLEFIDVDYDPEIWFDRIKGLEQEPERGKRCAACFDLRLAKTARYAYENHYKVFATTNGISRWKNLEQVNYSGQRAAAAYPGVSFLDRNWRLNNAQSKASLIMKNEGFYSQTYCGCSFSKKTISP